MANLFILQAQKGYVAIEIESLAVAWGIKKFHHVLYANHFIFETDQKLLEAILSKSLNHITPKLTADTDQNFCLPLNNKIHTWYYKPAC